MQRRDGLYILLFQLLVLTLFFVYIYNHEKGKEVINSEDKLSTLIYYKNGNKVILTIENREVIDGWPAICEEGFISITVQQAKKLVDDLNKIIKECEQ